MLEVCHQNFAECDVWIMSAAPADYKPAQEHQHKVKKTNGSMTHLELEKTPDILSNLQKIQTHQFIVGFAAESRDVINYAREKLQRKKLDMIVANDISNSDTGFASSTNAVTLIAKDGTEENIALAPKRDIADRILDQILRLRPQSSSAHPAVH